MSECWYAEVCESYGENCDSVCVRYAEMKFLMENSNLPIFRRRPQVLSPEPCDLKAYVRLDEIKQDIVDFVEHGRNLYICSKTTGNGKTSWAVKLMLRYFDQIWYGNGFRQRALFIHVPTFLAKCKDFNTVDTDFEEIKKRVQEVDLVVWDDIGGADMTAYDYTNLLVAIDAREANGKANIVTGNNVSSKELTKVVGQKIASRLFGKGCEIIEFKGGDRR